VSGDSPYGLPRPTEAFTVELVEARADVPDGWALLDRDFKPCVGRPAEMYDRPRLAIWVRLRPVDGDGYHPVDDRPVYVDPANLTAVLRCRAEKFGAGLHRARSLNHWWSLGEFSTPEAEAYFAKLGAEIAEREAAQAAELAAMTPRQIRAEAARIKKSNAEWAARTPEEREAILARRLAAGKRKRPRSEVSAARNTSERAVHSESHSVSAGPTTTTRGHQ